MTAGGADQASRLRSVLTASRDLLRDGSARLDTQTIRVLALESPDALIKQLNWALDHLTETNPQPKKSRSTTTYTDNLTSSGFQ